jgi:DNA-binding CsgD family transcriptional regulator/GAF domain-containing protein
VPSTGELSDIIAAVYDAGVEPEHWPEVLERVAELFDASYGGLVLTGPERHLEQIGSLGWDPSFVRSYGAHFGRMDPIVPAVIAAPVGTMLTDTMVMSQAEMDRNEFYQDWVRPQKLRSVLVTNLIRESANAGVALLSRRQEEGEFQQHDLDLLATLAPHIQRAMRTHLRMASLRAERNNAMGALDRLAYGILVTDQSCRIMLANRIAEEMLATADGVGSGRLGLNTATAAQTNELRRLVAQATGADRRTPVGGALLVDRPSMKRPFQVLISPLRADIGWTGRTWLTPVALVLIIDPERAPWSLERNLRTLFKLTRAEARVASEVATGEGLVGVAESLGILPSTARTHLHRVFEKTDTQRQAELVKLVERVAVLRTDEP